MSADERSAEGGFLARITIATAFGEGLDGYDLGTISVVLPLITTAFGLTAVEEGLIGASSLAGIFFGGPIFGYLTDRFGRRKIFILDLIAFVILGALQAVVDSSAVLFMLGLAIGAEYAIGQTMLAEFVPSEGRGRRLSSLQASWYGGFLLAVVVAYVLDGIGVNWQWILATGALPGLATLILRQGLPESPRWLVSVGREDEARRSSRSTSGATTMKKRISTRSRKTRLDSRGCSPRTCGGVQRSPRSSSPAWSRRTSRSSPSRPRCSRRSASTIPR